MHNIDENGYEKAARAGLIPFMRGEDGVLRYLMMVSSDPMYGGPRPMISKGKIERGESKLVGALREAEEELGFRQDNSTGPIFNVADERVFLHSGSYDLAVFGVEIVDKYNFDKWCDETEFTTWMTLESFKTKGRKDHVKYVEELERQVRSVCTAEFSS
jgi:8-oxo-dGTP pyrophosphatase MutT (NUDIX family)